jgi:hypothetical protein
MRRLWGRRKRPSSGKSSAKSEEEEEEEVPSNNGKKNPFTIIKHIAIKDKFNNRWPDNEIPFLFSPKFSERQWVLGGESPT